jgi:hypothetical protein
MNRCMNLLVNWLKDQYDLKINTKNGEKSSHIRAETIRMFEAFRFK